MAALRHLTVGQSQTNHLAMTRQSAPLRPAVPPPYAKYFGTEAISIFDVIRHCACSWCGMRGRRSDERFSFLEPVEGLLRVLRDVIVHRESDHEWTVIGREPAVVGEMLMLDVEDGDVPPQLTMCVIESRPVILDGDMRHRIRLHSSELLPILFEQQVRRG